MNKTKQYRIRLTEIEHAVLSALANDLGISMAEVLRRGVYIQSKQQNEKETQNAENS